MTSCRCSTSYEFSVIIPTWKLPNARNINAKTSTSSTETGKSTALTAPPPSRSVVVPYTCVKCGLNGFHEQKQRSQVQHTTHKGVTHTDWSRRVVANVETCRCLGKQRHHELCTLQPTLYLPRMSRNSCTCEMAVFVSRSRCTRHSVRE